MTTVNDLPLRTARDAVAGLRSSGSPVELAEALETLATAATEVADLAAAASSLEEAAGLWYSVDLYRHATCLLLAATTQRLRGELGAARHNLERAQAVSDVPDSVRHGLLMEGAEQALAGGDAQAAFDRFGEVLDLVLADEDPLARARVRQRRAAAALQLENWQAAAADLLDAQALFAEHGHHDEAEAVALAAAFAIAHARPEVGEEMWVAVVETPPRYGIALAQRGIIGGRIATLAGDFECALSRFDAARQGALDATDPIAYLTAVKEAVDAAKNLNDDRGAYGRLATAWVTVGDLLGDQAGRELVRPLLAELREDLGVDRFTAARAAYEAVRTSTDSQTG